MLRLQVLIGSETASFSSRSRRFRTVYVSETPYPMTSQAQLLFGSLLQDSNLLRQYLPLQELMSMPQIQTTTMQIQTTYKSFFLLLLSSFSCNCAIYEILTFSLNCLSVNEKCGNCCYQFCYPERIPDTDNTKDTTEYKCSRNDDNHIAKQGDHQ